MGSFFTNLHVRGTAPETAVEGLRHAAGLPAYVTEPGQGWISLYPKATESQDLALLERIAKGLSIETRSPVYASLVHDSDVWNFLVAVDGRLVDQYCSRPGYFSGVRRRPSGGKASALLPLCRPGTSVVEIEDLLRRHLTVGQPLPEELAARLGASVEEQKRMLAETYEQAKAGFTALGAKMPSLETLMKQLDRRTRKVLTGSGRADAAEDLARAFAQMLGIPDGRAELGYTYIDRGEAPDGMARLVTA